MKSPHPLLARFVERELQYIGSGVNHEKEEFTATLAVTPVGDATAAQMHFVATGSDGTVYHDEQAFLAPDDNGELTLAGVSSTVRHSLSTSLSRLTRQRNETGLNEQARQGRSHSRTVTLMMPRSSASAAL